MKQTELLAPGGSFESALAALENGADAVYCGLQSFSARKAAKNLSPDQLSRIKKLALGRGKKVYLTLNTILQQEELPRVIDVLFLARDLSLDGIIVQDPGLIKIVRDHFPQLTLHGSTQMAVHNSWGLQALKDAGFSRAVLPRELTLQEIKELHQRHPHMELEVFIHGAQCYGLSGMCLASGLLLGRSGNRGDCGQICRTWFTHSNQQGYYFSCNDLYSGKDVLKAVEAGVTSLKIEGRMKSPAYSAAVSRLYRHILDRKDPEALPALEEDVRTAFSRKPVKGHLFSGKGEGMINSDYPGHLGIPAGIVKGLDNKGMAFTAQCKLSTRDGLMFLNEEGKPVSFSLRFTEKRNTASSGLIRVQTPHPAPPPGAMLYKVQSHDHHWKETKPESLPRYVTPVHAKITLSRSVLTVAIPHWEFSHPFPIETEEAKEPQVLRDKIMEEMGKSAEYDFQLIPEIVPDTTRTGKGLFLPPSRIKKIRQELYRLFEEYRKQSRLQKREGIIDLLNQEWEAFQRETSFSLPPRSEWAPVSSSLPYLTDFSMNRRGQAPGRDGDRTFLPLSPIQFPGKEDAYLEALDSLTAPKQYEKVYGLNNWGHIGLFRSQSLFQNSSYLLDVGLLTANTAGVLLFNALLPGNLLGCYGWVESPREDLPPEFSDPGDAARLPLFISRNCFKKHSLNQSCKNCGRSETYDLVQNGNPYTVIVEDCISWIFQGKTDSPRDSASK